MPSWSPRRSRRAGGPTGGRGSTALLCSTNTLLSCVQMPGPDIQPAAAAAAGPGRPALPLQPGRQPRQGGRQAGRAGHGGGEERAPRIIRPRLNLAGVAGVAAEGVQQVRVPSLRQRPRGGFRLPDQEKVRVRRSTRHGGRIRAKEQASLCDICSIFPHPARMKWS